MNEIAQGLTVGQVWFIIGASTLILAYVIGLFKSMVESYHRGESYDQGFRIGYREGAEAITEYHKGVSLNPVQHPIE